MEPSRVPYRLRVRDQHHQKHKYPAPEIIIYYLSHSVSKAGSNKVNTKFRPLHWHYSFLSQKFSDQFLTKSFTVTDTQHLQLRVKFTIQGFLRIREKKYKNKFDFRVENEISQ